MPTHGLGSLVGDIADVARHGRQCDLRDVLEQYHTTLVFTLAAAFARKSQAVQDLEQFGRLNMFGQNTHCAERTRLADIQIALLGGVHHDRDGGGIGVALDGLDGLEAIHVRHHVIHEDHIRCMAGQVVNCLGR